MSAFLDFTDSWWVAVASHLWQTTIVVAVLWLLSLALRRAPARVLNALWWVALGKLVLPFSLIAPTLGRELGRLAGALGSESEQMEAVTVWLHRAAPVLDPVSSVASPARGTLGAVGLALAVAWLAGACWFLVVWYRSRDRLVMRGAMTLRDAPEAVRRRVENALESTGLPSGAVLVTRESVTPAVVGVFRRRVLVPVDVVTQLEPRELRAVLLHEDAHRRRFEPLQMLVQRAAVLAFYFFPLLWPVLRRLRETSEMACDEAAVRRGVSAADYARALARALCIELEPLGLAVGLACGRSTLTRNRFERLRSEGRFRLQRWHWACIAVAVLAAVATAVIAAVPTVATAGESSAISTSVSASERGQAKVEVTEDADETEVETYAVTLVKSVPPAYPDDALKAGVEGRVMLELDITPDGTVGEVTATQEVEGYPSMTEAAVEAARQWVFEIQGDLDDEENIEVLVPIEFRLDGKDTQTLTVTVQDDADDPGDADEPGEPEEAEDAD